MLRRIYDPSAENRREEEMIFERMLSEEIDPVAACKRLHYGLFEIIAEAYFRQSDLIILGDGVRSHTLERLRALRKRLRGSGQLTLRRLISMANVLGRSDRLKTAAENALPFIAAMACRLSAERWSRCVPHRLKRRMQMDDVYHMFQVMRLLLLFDNDDAGRDGLFTIAFFDQM